MGKLATIALTSFQETLHRRVLYLVLLLVLLILGVTTTQMLYVRMAVQAGETETVTAIARQLFESTIGIWEFSSFFLAIFLGAVGISSELKSKTIVSVLSRPVSRWVYLLGRWLGILMFLWAFLAIGIGVALTLGAFFNVHFAPIFWLGVAEIFGAAAVLSGVSLGLSVFLAPVAAGAATFFLLILPGLTLKGMDSPRWFVRLLATAGYYLSPAQSPGSLIHDSLKKEMVDPKYLLYIQVLTENLLYTAAVLLIACLIFQRRELRLR